jgi:hypothetical protein
MAVKKPNPGVQAGVSLDWVRLSANFSPYYCTIPGANVAWGGRKALTDAEAAIQPRTSELARRGPIRKSGRRRLDATGRNKKKLQELGAGGTFSISHRVTGISGVLSHRSSKPRLTLNGEAPASRERCTGRVSTEFGRRPHSKTDIRTQLNARQSATETVDEVAPPRPWSCSYRPLTHGLSFSGGRRDGFLARQAPTHARDDG